MENKPYAVYVRINAGGYIVAVASSAFLSDTTGWKELDSGFGDRYYHAQGNYFPLPVITDGGAYRYKMSNGEAGECTADEIAAQEAANAAEHEPSQKERISKLEEQNELLMQCILELSEIVYA